MSSCCTRSVHRLSQLPSGHPRAGFVQFSRVTGLKDSRFMTSTFPVFFSTQG